MQSGKSGGLSGAFGGSGEVFGGKAGGLDAFLSKVTMVTGALFGIVTLLLAKYN